MCFDHSLFFIPVYGLLLLIILVLAVLLRYYFLLSLKDEMTSVASYRGFRRKIKKTIAKRTLFTIAIFDIDRFSRFNDVSYDLGDKVLIDFASFISEQLPEDSFVARFRFGDEFIVILNSGKEEASEIIKKIQQNCKDIIPYEKQPEQQYHFSFSFGLAAFENASGTLEILLNKAEASLKESKKIMDVR
jgi:diguanylate cyclase (GGDEF)-like protein